MFWLLAFLPLLLLLLAFVFKQKGCATLYATTTGIRNSETGKNE